MPQILVTGAAGYIGSAITSRLVSYGHQVFGLDNLHQGHSEAIIPGSIFFEADISNVPLLQKIFRENDIYAVIHLAGLTQVGASVLDPGPYYNNNVLKGLILLDTMLECGVTRIIFSSSASIYGNPGQLPISEEEPSQPTNPYGTTKAVFEDILSWYKTAYGMTTVSLRYFNAAGSTGTYGEDHAPETHLIPNIFKVALGQAQSLTVFGNNHPTADGTAVRDYVHIEDIADIHIRILEKIDRVTGATYNVGLGSGHSIQETVTLSRLVTGHNIPVQILGPRPGDPATLVAETSKLKSHLGWVPIYESLESIIESAWQWHRINPKGYQSGRPR